MDARTSAHISEAGRDTAIRTGGLTEVIRDRNITPATFDQHFETRVLGIATSPDEARELEVIWIAALNARFPNGLNLQPGGRSLGGPANSMAVTVKIGSSRKSYPSIGAALADRNRSALERGKAVIERSTVHARLLLGWGVAEALGYKAHADGRGQREEFTLGGVVYSTLREASAASGISIPTLRSRLHRARDAAEPGAVLEIGRDRRADNVGRRKMLGLKHPVTGQAVSVREYARATGLPVSTVIHRAHRHGVEASLATMLLPVERRKAVSHEGLDGKVIHLGFRETVRRVLGPNRQQLPGTRPLSHSGIRARLRRLTEVERSNVEYVRWACGQLPGNPSYADVVAREAWRARRRAAKAASVRSRFGAPSRHVSSRP